MTNSRREFLKGTAWLGVTAVAAGCMGDRLRIGGAGGAPMANFRVAPMETVRVGFIGLGPRGRAAVNRVAMIPGCRVVALCDLKRECVDEAQKALADAKKPKAKEFVGDDTWKRLADSSDVDVLYIATPIDWHTPMGLYGMKAGKHVLLEVIGCNTVEEGWALVETAEETRRHCMMLENCCYGEYELLAHNLCKQGLLGDIVHGEGSYIHDCRMMELKDEGNWRIKRAAERMGNQYPTHGLGPICVDMNINRGDRLDYLTSVDSCSLGLEHAARENYPADAWQRKLKFRSGDINTTTIRTALGKTIVAQYCVKLPRPYSRANLVCGTKGCLQSYPGRSPNREFLHVAWEEKAGDKGAHYYFDDKKTEEVRAKYRHPLWKEAGAIAEKVGGHGGMDFLMDLRWAYCLQNGLPLDIDVYDLASWSAVYALSEVSAQNRGTPVDIPDFTRGAWKTAKPFDIGGVDLGKMGPIEGVVGDKKQMSV